MDPEKEKRFRFRARYEAEQAKESAPVQVATQEPQAGLLQRGAQWAGRQLERVPAAIRGGVQAYQTGDPHQAANMAYQGLKDPASVQTSSEMMGRFGADTAMNKPQIKTPPPDAKTQWASLGNVPDETKERILGFKLTPETTYTSQAKELGQAYDVLAPTGLEIIPGAKLALKGAAGAAKKGAKVLTGAAEKSILEKYSMAKAMKLAPRIGSGKEIEAVADAERAIQDAPKIIAEKLREHDLLYNPGKANFNLQRDLKSYGNQIGETVKDMKSRDVSVNLQSVLDKYVGDKIAALQSSGKGVGSAEDFQSKVVPKLQSMIDALGHDGAGNVAIDKSVAFRQELQDMVKNWGADSPTGPLVQRVAKELQHQTNKAIAGSDKAGLKLAALNDKYGDLKDLQPLIEDAYTRGFGRSAVGRDVRPLPFTREGIVNRAAEVVGSPVKSTMNAFPKVADRWANKGRTSAGLTIPEAALTVTDADLQALKAPFLADDASRTGPGYLPPRQPQGRRALDKAPEYIPGQPREGLPPRTPTNTRRSLEEKPVTYVRYPAEGLPPREPKFQRRPLESTQIADDAFLKVLEDAKGWPPGLNQQKIEFLVRAYKHTKPTQEKAKIMSRLRAEFSKADELNKARGQ